LGGILENTGQSMKEGYFHYHSNHSSRRYVWHSWKSKYLCDERSKFSEICQSVAIIQLLRAVFFLCLESRQTKTHFRLLRESNIFNNILPRCDFAYTKEFIYDINNNNFK